jgi:hypothetical protein
MELKTISKNEVCSKSHKSRGIIFCFSILATLLIGISNIKAQSVSATIEKLWEEYDVFQGSEKGMKIHVKFSVNNMLNKTGTCNAYFYYKNGLALNDYNQHYYTSDGKVSTGEKYTPSYTNAIYEDLVLFIPYSELHLGDGRHDIKFQIQIFDNNTRSITKSNYREFYINWNQQNKNDTPPTYTQQPTYIQPTQPQTKNYYEGNNDLTVFLKDSYESGKIDNSVSCINYSGRQIEVYISYTRDIYYDTYGNQHIETKEVKFKKCTINSSQSEQRIASGYGGANRHGRIRNLRVEKYIIY